MSQDRPTLGERLANRLSSRSRRRPRMALDASFYARFGLEDPWSTPEIEAQAESGDGMVFLSGAPFYSMMRRLGAARRRRERRQERFFQRRAGTTMRAATRRWAGEAEAVVPTFRSAAFSPDAFVLPAPVSSVPEVAEVEPAVAARAPYQAMRPVKSAWYTTPFIPARVIRSQAGSAAATDEDRRAIDPAARPRDVLRPMQRIGERLRSANVETAERATVVGQLPARLRRAIATVIVEDLPAEMTVVEVVKILRRMGAPALVIREIVEIAPEAAATAVAARRMPSNPATRSTGLRPALSRSPAMALASSADADHAATGTLADSERSEVRTGADRPRRAYSKPGQRASQRAAAPSASSALSASPVSRASAGRPAGLRAAPVLSDSAGHEAAGPSRSQPQLPVRAAARVSRLIGGRFLPAASAVERAEGVESDGASSQPASAHAVSRAERAAPFARPRSIARSDGAAWAFIRSEEPALAEAHSVVPTAVPALRRPAIAQASAARPVIGSAGRFVTARLAAATGALTPRASGSPARTAPLATAVSGSPSRGRARLAAPGRSGADRALTALVLPAAGASPMQQALGRMATAEPPPPGPTASAIPHATPRLDRPVRRAQVLAADGFTALTPDSPALVGSDAAPRSETGSGSIATAVRRPATGSPATAKTVAAAPARAVTRAAERATGRATAESASQIAVRRVDGPRVSTSEIVRSNPAALESDAGPQATGPMSWARGASPSRAPVVSRRVGGRTVLVDSRVDRAAIPGSAPVREASGRFVAARSVPSDGPIRAAAGVRQGREPRVEERGVARFSSVGGRVNVAYVSPDSFAATPDLAAPGDRTPARAVRSLAWAGARSQVSGATAYRGAIGDGGLPAAERSSIAGFDPGLRRSRASGGAGITVLAGPSTSAGATDGIGSATGDPAAVSTRRPNRAAPERAAGSARTARPTIGAPARRAVALGNDAFVAPSSFGFAGPDSQAAEGFGDPAASPSPVAPRPASRRLPLDRRLHGMATGGGGSATGGLESGAAPNWTARAEGAPLVRSVHGLFESLARATTAEQVVHVLFARADGILAAPGAVSAPIQQVISEIRQEVSRATPAATSEDAALPTRPSRLAAPQAEPLRPLAGGSRPVSSTRVARGSVRPVVSRARGIGSGSEDRIMGLVKKLQGLIHLAEAEHRLAEAQRQVRMAEDSHEARGEGGQGTRGPGQAGSSQDGSKMDIEQLGREVLDVVSRELEFRRERRMEDHDESIWW